MSTPIRGLYDSLLTEALASSLGSFIETGEADLVALRNPDAADRIALHFAKVVERALESLPENDRAAIGVGLARYLIDEISRTVNNESLVAEKPDGTAGYIVRYGRS